MSDFRKYLTLFRLWGNRFAYVWADLRAAAKSKGIDIPLAEGMIAAIAKRHELTVATRNVGDFKHTKVKTVNPYETKG